MLITQNISICSISAPARVIRNTTLAPMFFTYFRPAQISLSVSHVSNQLIKPLALTIIFRRFRKFNSYGVNWLSLITWSSSTTKTRHWESRYSLRLKIELTNRTISRHLPVVVAVNHKSVAHWLEYLGRCMFQLLVGEGGNLGQDDLEYRVRF